MRPASESATSRGGFVIFFVVLMLFAISITAVTGYLVVDSEFSLSNHAKEGAEVISVAHGGMQRFLADQTGGVGDSVVYEIGLGIAIVTSRKLMEKDSLNHLYYLRSEGTLNDIRTPGAPVARRVVGAFAWHRLSPMVHRAALIVSADDIDTSSGGEVDGDDDSLPTDCQGGGTAGITGGIAKDRVRGNVDGNPRNEIRDWVVSDMADSLRIRWDVLQDPSFPFEFDFESGDSPPNFSSLPADSFPIVRFQGDLAPASSWSGRGLLVITGEFNSRSGFDWKGIVLAGSTDDGLDGDVEGMMVLGLDGPNPYSDIDVRMDVEYNACYVYAANRTLSYLELVDNTIFEAY